MSVTVYLLEVSHECGPGRHVLKMTRDYPWTEDEELTAEVTLLELCQTRVVDIVGQRVKVKRYNIPLTRRRLFITTTSGAPAWWLPNFSLRKRRVGWIRRGYQFDLGRRPRR